MRDFFRPGRSPVYAGNAMVATSHPLASQAGIQILKEGGNAVDAAIAACAVLCVVEPAMTGIGGDCFALYVPAGRSRPIALNGSGRAPAAADVAALRGLGLTEIGPDSVHSVTIPAAIAGWTRLLEDHGTKDLAALLAPAIAFAENGYPVYPRVAADWAWAAPRLRNDAPARAQLLVDDQPPSVGSVHRQPRLAATLRTIAARGRDGFYTGDVAADMVRHLRSHGGLHSMEDFAAAEADYVEPIHTTHAGHLVYECPPNGQGIAALILLNILSGFDLAGLDEAGRVHLTAEAAKLAVRERDRYVSDPDQVEVPVERLLSSAHADALRARIDEGRAGPFHDSDFPNHEDTTYLCAVDRDGNAISFINSLFAAFGSALLAPQSGVVLHNRGWSFKLIEGHANAIAPGKRTMHTIIPGMVMRDGHAVCPFGVMGGHYQAVGHATLLTNLLDRGMDIQEAIDDPRSLAYAGSLQVEPTHASETFETLRRLGHPVELPPRPLGGAQAVWIDRASGLLIGGSEPRKDGCAIGY